jgi:sirohydrochlorin cobaltochelatase
VSAIEALRAPAPAGLLLVGHGSADPDGVEQYHELRRLVLSRAPGLDLSPGFIELAEPDLVTAVETLAASGVATMVAVPLVLLPAGHLKNDGAAAVRYARERFCDLEVRYARHIGLDPAILELAAERALEASRRLSRPLDAVVSVGRGSSDPDANSDLYKAARLLADGRGLPAVEPAFVSLTWPSVPEALERAWRLGARSIVVAPFFLFTGVLVKRIAEQARRFAEEHPDVEVAIADVLGTDPRVAGVVLERFAEAVSGPVAQTCDRCCYRVPMPGVESRVGQAVPMLPGHHHDGGHDHDGHHHDGHHHDGHEAGRASAPSSGARPA